MTSPIIGGFVSSAGGPQKAIDRATKKSFRAAMFFIGSPHTWKIPTLTPSQVEAYDNRIKSSNITYTVAHALYLINLATPNVELYRKSIIALTRTMTNASLLGLDGVIIHLGSYKQSTLEKGLARTSQAIDQVLSDSPGTTRLIIENTVPQGHKVGTNFQQIDQILKKVAQPDRLGVCLDTCHSFSSGYDFRVSSGIGKFVRDVQASFGFQKVRCLHINDSQHPLNSHRDHHANLGQGHIGLESLANLINHPALPNIPLILEIPGKEGQGPGRADKELLESLLKPTG